MGIENANIGQQKSALEQLSAAGKEELRDTITEFNGSYFERATTVEQVLAAVDRLETTLRDNFHMRNDVQYEDEELGAVITVNEDLKNGIKQYYDAMQAGDDARVAALNDIDIPQAAKDAIKRIVKTETSQQAE